MYRSIAIKPSDKGTIVMPLNTTDYKDEAYRQPNLAKFYKNISLIFSGLKNSESSYPLHLTPYTFLKFMKLAHPKYPFFPASAQGISDLINFST